MIKVLTASELDLENLLYSFHQHLTATDKANLKTLAQIPYSALFDKYFNEYLHYNRKAVRTATGRAAELLVQPDVFYLDFQALQDKHLTLKHLNAPMPSAFSKDRHTNQFTLRSNLQGDDYFTSLVFHNINNLFNYDDLANKFLNFLQHPSRKALYIAQSKAFNQPQITYLTNLYQLSIWDCKGNPTTVTPEQAIRDYQQAVAQQTQLNEFAQTHEPQLNQLVAQYQEQAQSSKKSKKHKSEANSNTTDSVVVAHNATGLNDSAVTNSTSATAHSATGTSSTSNLGSNAALQVDGFTGATALQAHATNSSAALTATSPNGASATATLAQEILTSLARNYKANWSHLAAQAYRGVALTNNPALQHLHHQQQKLRQLLLQGLINSYLSNSEAWGDVTQVRNHPVFQALSQTSNYPVLVDLQSCNRHTLFGSFKPESKDKDYQAQEAQVVDTPVAALEQLIAQQMQADFEFKAVDFVNSTLENHPTSLSWLHQDSKGLLEAVAPQALQQVVNRQSANTGYIPGLLAIPNLVLVLRQTQLEANPQLAQELFAACGQEQFTLKQAENLHRKRLVPELSIPVNAKLIVLSDGCPSETFDNLADFYFVPHALVSATNSLITDTKFIRQGLDLQRAWELSGRNYQDFLDLEWYFKYFYLNDEQEIPAQLINTNSSSAGTSPSTPTTSSSEVTKETPHNSREQNITPASYGFNPDEFTPLARALYHLPTSEHRVTLQQYLQNCLILDTYENEAGLRYGYKFFPGNAGIIKAELNEWQGSPRFSKHCNISTPINQHGADEQSLYALVDIRAQVHQASNELLEEALNAPYDAQFDQELCELSMAQLAVQELQAQLENLGYQVLIPNLDSSHGDSKSEDKLLQGAQLIALKTEKQEVTTYNLEEVYTALENHQKHYHDLKLPSPGLGAVLHEYVTALRNFHQAYRDFALTRSVLARNAQGDLASTTSSYVDGEHQAELKNPNDNSGSFNLSRFVTRQQEQCATEFYKYGLDSRDTSHRYQHEIDLTYLVSNTNLYYLSQSYNYFNLQVQLALYASCLGVDYNHSLRYNDYLLAWLFRESEDIESLVMAPLLMERLSHEAKGDSKRLKALQRSEHFTASPHYQQQLQSTLNNSQRIETSGFAIGQVNGLAVVDSYEWSREDVGEIFRLAAFIQSENGEITDIDNEIGYAGSLAIRANIVSSTYIKSLFDTQVHFTGSILTEQLYAETDGDSATVTSFCALASALGGIPVNQGIALTGALDLTGTVCAVSGLNQKIEAFHHLVATRREMDLLIPRLHGVIIPAVNQNQLQLSEAVIQDIRAGKFFIFAVEHASDALEILAGKSFVLPQQDEEIATPAVLELESNLVHALSYVNRVRANLIKAHFTPDYLVQHQPEYYYAIEKAYPAHNFEQYKKALEASGRLPKEETPPEHKAPSTTLDKLLARLPWNANRTPSKEEQVSLLAMMAGSGRKEAGSGKASLIGRLLGSLRKG